MTPRKILFWLHLTAGSIAGLVILVRCVTGVLLATQRSVIHYAERGFRVTPQPESLRTSLAALLDTAGAAKSAIPSSAMWRSDLRIHLAEVVARMEVCA